jgi:hypothetical protein
LDSRLRGKPILSALVRSELNEPLSVGAPAQQRLHFVVRAQERDIQLGRAILEDESEREVAAAFEQLAAKLSDSDPAVTMWLAEAFRQLAQREKTLDPFVLRQFSQAAKNVRVDGKKLSQASS